MPSTPPSGGNSPVSRFDSGHMFHPPPPLQHAPMRPGMIPFRMPPGAAMSPGMQIAADPRQMHPPQYALQRMAAQEFMAPPPSSGTTVGSPMGMAPTAPSTTQSAMAASSQLPGMTHHPAAESRPRPAQQGALHQPAKSDVEKGDDHLDELLGEYVYWQRSRDILKDPYFMLLFSILWK